jgi:predicted transcriptional regulator of viral defense system
MLDIFNSKAFIIFTTREYANHANLSVSAATKKLTRLKDNKLLTHVTKNVWANAGHPYFHPASCVPYLLNKEQGYVSFLTALHFHGLLSQIPKTIQVATTGHSRTLDSIVARYEFIQIKPELMQAGIMWSETQLPYSLATAEKALIDVLYIATRKNRRFASLPEITLTTDVFNNKTFEQLLKNLPLSTRILNAMQLRAEELGAMDFKETMLKNKR